MKSLRRDQWRASFRGTISFTVSFLLSLRMSGIVPWRMRGRWYTCGIWHPLVLPYSHVLWKKKHPSACRGLATPVDLALFRFYFSMQHLLRPARPFEGACPCYAGRGRFGKRFVIIIGVRVLSLSLSLPSSVCTYIHTCAIRRRGVHLSCMSLHHFMNADIENRVGDPAIRWSQRKNYYKDIVTMRFCKDKLRLICYVDMIL